VLFGTSHGNATGGWIVFGIWMAAVTLYLTYRTATYGGARRRYRAEHGVPATTGNRIRAVPPFMAGKRGARFVVALIAIGVIGLVAGPLQIASSPTVSQGWVTTAGGVVLLVSGVYWGRLRRTGDVQAVRHARPRR
jgi:hypothetical protein